MTDYIHAGQAASLSSSSPSSSSLSSSECRLIDSAQADDAALAARSALEPLALLFGELGLVVLPQSCEQCFNHGDHV
jgi:hypothetical protein